MPDQRRQLRDALTELLTAPSEPNETARKRRVSAALTRVLHLQKRFGPETHPMLRHYLERRSYQKALDFLNEGRPETETPQCGH